MSKPVLAGPLKIVLFVALSTLAVLPVHGAANLVPNGDFEGSFLPDGSGDSLPAGWMKQETRDPPETSIVFASAFNGPSRPGSSSLRWMRTNGDASGDWSAIWQPLAIDASSYAGLQLSVDIRVRSHDLEAGGWVTPAFEWPVVVELRYTLASDPARTQVWRHGWYVDPPGDSVTGPAIDPGDGIIAVFDDTPVPADTWTTTTFDLLAELPDLGVITRITVGGSGWNYEGSIDNVEITGPAAWKASFPNYSPSGMPDFDQRQDRWARRIVCGPDLVANTTADPGSDDQELPHPGGACTAPESDVIRPGPDRILQTVAHPADRYEVWDWCVPTAVANCLWWFDSQYADPAGMTCDGSDTYDLVTAHVLSTDDHCPDNVDQLGTPPGGVPPDPSTAFGELIEDLAWRMDTSGQRLLDPSHGAGTTASDARVAVQRYLQERGLQDDYIVQLVKAPSYEWIQREIGRSQDLILFLAFSQFCNDEWHYVGGHAVTVAGVVPGMATPICVSDPYFDNAEQAAPGRVLPGGVPHPHPGPPETLHNDAQLVSHDCYAWSSGTSPYGVMDLIGYAEAEPGLGCEEIENFARQNAWEPYDPKFEPLPCDPACPVQTQIAYALEISPGFFWKAGDWQDYSPSGVPDFDQKQSPGFDPLAFTCPADGAWSHCGPAAVANSLWWFDSVFEPAPLAPPAVNDNYPLLGSFDVWDDHDPQNVELLLADLGFQMNTNNQNPAFQRPDFCGTYVDDMVQGISTYLTNAGLGGDYYVDVLVSPTFEDVAAEVEKSQDVVLLLGFWEDQAGTPQRIGGHYVTVAGVDREVGAVAFSDPFRNAAEDGTGDGSIRGDVPHAHPFTIWFPKPLPGPVMHFISLPRVISHPRIASAQDLCDALAAADLDPVSVARHVRSTDLLQEWDCLTGGACAPCGGDCFCIDPLQGEGYFVTLLNGGSLVLEGTDLTSEIVMEGASSPVSETGQNAIALPFASNLHTADDLLNDIPSAIEVARFLPLVSGFQIYTGITGTNFSIIPGEAYMVRVLNSSFYTPGTTAPPHEVHNDAQNVSHDVYDVVPTATPQGTWGPEGYAVGLGPHGVANFQCHNLAEPEQGCAPYQGGPIVTTVERAVEVSPCPADADGDTFRPVCDGDCDDTDPEIYPGAPERCNGLDDDCDGVIPSWDVDNDGDGIPEVCGGDCDDSSDVTYPGAAQNEIAGACMKDADDDGFGDSMPPPSVDPGSDCDDTNPDVYTGAPEICDGVNNNCSDPGWPNVLPFDIDNDGDGVPEGCGGDCDDTDPMEFPGQLWYADCDADGVARSVPVQACELGEADVSTPCADGQPPDGGWSHTAQDDCDDEDPARYPRHWYADCDGDAFPRPAPVLACDLPEADLVTPCVDTLPPDGGWSSLAGRDCDDEDPTINPASIEIIADGVDQNCDGFDDCFQDLDGDGYGSSFVVTDNDLDCANGSSPTSGLSGDCDDADPTEFPGQVWFADCDGDTVPRSSALTACDAAEADVLTPCADALPPDGGWSHVAGADCDDEDAAAYPAAAEVVADGIDQNCDGFDDCYEDLDADGFGSATVVTDNDLDCANGSVPNMAAVNNDCDDGDPTEFPGQVWYADCDGDTYERSADVTACDEAQADSLTPCADAQLPDGGWSHVAGNDCDDEDAAVRPGASEVVADGVDQNCDTFDDCYEDLDGDGYGTSTIVTDDDLDCANTSTANTAAVDGDCDDATASIYPGAPQVCSDGLNNDCDHPSWPGLTGTNEWDDDADTWSECNGDCDDTNATIYAAAPQLCGDGLNNDCGHPSWPGLAGTNEFDDDGDTHTECAGDCDDGNAQAWNVPGEVRSVLADSKDQLRWTAPADPGGTVLLYDTLRSAAADDFLSQGVCVETDDGSDENVTDTATPGVGQVLFYLIRAQNGCPGEGTLGYDSVGNERGGRGCPSEFGFCDNATDDDGDTLVDCLDPDCALDPVCPPAPFTGPTDDATLDQYQPNVNRGTGGTLSVRNNVGGSSSNWGWDALVRFDLSYLPANATIVSARINLYYWRYKDSNPAGRSLRAYRVTGPWQEETVTWNTRPGHAATYTSETTVPSAFGWMSWDVTADVQDFVDGVATNHGWEIRDEQAWGGGGIPITRLYAKEHGSFIPYITVEYTE